MSPGQNPAPYREPDEIGLCVQPQLPHHIAAMDFHRARADRKLLGKFRVSVAFCGQVQHFSFGVVSLSKGSVGVCCQG
jgi:hypothetical protein